MPVNEKKVARHMQLGKNLARILLPVLFAAFVAAGCSGGAAFGGIPDDAVCVVDGTAITRKEFDRMMKSQKLQAKQSQQDFPKKGSKEYKELTSNLVDAFVTQKLIQNQAKKLGITASKKEIDKSVDEIKQQVAQGDEKQFKEAMKRYGYTIELVRRDQTAEVIGRKLYERIVSDVKISDADVKKYYEDNPDKFTTKESRDVAHILVDLKDKKKADELYEQLKGGDKKLFTKLAKKYSTDPGSKEKGGLYANTQQGQMVPEFDKVTFDLKTGEVSRPVKTQFGWHIITARSDIKPATKKKFSEVKEEIRAQLKSENEGSRYQEYQTNVLEDAEDSVKCRDGYVWKQTVTETDTAPEPVAEEPAKEDKKKKSDKKDAKKSDKKGDKKGDEKSDKKSSK